MTYTFDFVDAGGSIDHFQLHYCADHEEAVRWAVIALKDSAIAATVEVWCEAARIARISPFGQIFLLGR